MFKIKYVNYFVEGEKEFTLKEGKPNLQPVDNGSNYPPTVLELRASGEELSFVHAYFRGVPTRMCKEEVIWNGSYAQFIFDNL
jgi:hypothetical protein